MLKEQRPFKFFKVPVSYMKEFAREAKEHGLLYVPIRNRQKSDRIEVVVFADDASKIQRIYDNLGLDYVAAQAGDATVEKAPVQEKQPPAAAAPSRMETVQTEHGAVEFEVGGFEDEIELSSVPDQEEGANFTPGREKDPVQGEAAKSPSENSSPDRCFTKSRRKSPVGKVKSLPIPRKPRPIVDGLPANTPFQKDLSAGTAAVISEG